ncbi:MAG: hypothetical protein ACJAS9_002296 [Polaribacter sp.]|jgi:hypothetical protein
MNTIDLPLLFMVEAAAPFFILSIVLATALMNDKKKMKEAAKQLILDVKGSEKRDRDAVKFFLKEQLNLDEKQVKMASKKILNERKFLLRNIISGILDKNLEAISLLNQDLDRVCKQYHQLELAEVEVLLEEPKEEPKEDKTKALTKEIKGLKQEVHITLTTLNNIFKEFSSMFGEDAPDGDMSVDQIITAMESFSNKETSSTSESDETISEPEPELETEQEQVDEVSENTDEEVGSIEQVDDILKDTNISEEPLAEDASISEQLENILGDDATDDLDFSDVDAVDDIDGALDMLELDSTDEEEGEPDWGDAFAESGDVMEDDKES